MPFRSYDNEITWEAIYDGGVKSLHQYYSDSVTAHPYTEIDRKRLTHFRLWRLVDRPGGTVDEPFFMLMLDEGQRLIWRRRVEMNNRGKKDVVHLAGWQMNVKGKNVQSIAYVWESDGTVAVAGKWRPENGLMYSPNIQEYEE